MTAEQVRNYEDWRKKLSPWIERIFDIRVIGRENFPTDGAALIVGNHRSFIDPYFVAYACRRPINFLAASFTFHLPIVKGMYRSWGALSLPLAGGAKTEKTLTRAIDLLKGGELVGIFPEGVDSMIRRNLHQKVARFHTGFARVALSAGVPILPCSVTGLGEYVMLFIPARLNEFLTQERRLARGVYIYFYRKIVVRVGKPVSTSVYQEDINKAKIHRTSSKIRRIITALYEGEGVRRFVYGTEPFDIDKDYV